MNTLKCSASALQKAKGELASLRMPCMAFPLYISLLLGSMPPGVQAATWKKVAVAVVIGAVGLTQSEQGMHKVPASRGELIDNVFAHRAQDVALHTHPMDDYSIERPASLDAQARMVMPDFSIPHRLQRAMEALRPAEKVDTAPRTLLSNPYKIQSLLNPIPRFAAKAAPLSANETTTSTTRAATTTYKPKGEKDWWDEANEVEFFWGVVTGIGFPILMLILCCWILCANTRSCPFSLQGPCYCLCHPVVYVLCCYSCSDPGGGAINGCKNFWCCKWGCWKWCCKTSNTPGGGSQENVPQEQQEMVIHGRLQTLSNEHMSAPTTLLTIREHE